MAWLSCSDIFLALGPCQRCSCCVACDGRTSSLFGVPITGPGSWHVVGRCCAICLGTFTLVCGLRLLRRHRPQLIVRCCKGGEGSSTLDRWISHAMSPGVGSKIVAGFQRTMNLCIASPLFSAIVTRLALCGSDVVDGCWASDGRSMRAAAVRQAAPATSCRRRF